MSTSGDFQRKIRYMQRPHTLMRGKQEEREESNGDITFLWANGDIYRSTWVKRSKEKKKKKKRKE